MKLGEQWIEMIDGQEHMVKAVDSTYNCNGCAFLGDSGKCLHSSILECPVYRIDAIIKDLGIIKNGRLPCPFCGEYPEIGHFGDGFSPITFYISHKDDNCEMMWLRSISFQTEQQAIDAWNRRT